MKATKEPIDEELRVIKLFASNYARDLMNHYLMCTLLLIYTDFKL